MRKTESVDGCEETTVVCTWTYCHLLMLPGSCTPHIRAPPETCEERLRNFQNLFKGGEDFSPRGTLLQAADRCCSRCSVITGQAYGHFLAGEGRFWSSLTPLCGGHHPSLSAAQSGLLRQDTITRTPRGGWWISWPPGCGSNNPCSPVSKCRSAAEQLNMAGEAVGEPLQALER